MSSGSVWDNEKTKATELLLWKFLNTYIGMYRIILQLDYDRPINKMLLYIQIHSF